MSTMIGDVSQRMKAGRESIGKSLGEMQDKVDSERMTRMGIVAGVAMVALAVGIGYAVYRSRRHHTLAGRIQRALPDAVRDLPDSVRERLKKAL